MATVLKQFLTHTLTQDGFFTQVVLTGTIGDSLLLHSYCSMLLLDTSPMCLCVCVYLYVYTHTHTQNLFFSFQILPTNDVLLPFTNRS